MPGNVAGAEGRIIMNARNPRWGRLPRKVWLAGAVIGLAGLLLGCTTPPPPVPTVTLGPNDWLISSAGIGPYHLGDPYTPDPGPGGGYVCTIKWTTEPDHGTVAIADTTAEETYDPSKSHAPFVVRMVQLDVNEKVNLTGTRTIYGIGPGSTRAEVMAAYPNAKSDPDKTFDIAVITENGVPIVFSFGLIYPNIKPQPTDPVRTVVVGSGAPLYTPCA